MAATILVFAAAFPIKFILSSSIAFESGCSNSSRGLYDWKFYSCGFYAARGYASMFSSSPSAGAGSSSAYLCVLSKRTQQMRRNPRQNSSMRVTPLVFG